MTAIGVLFVILQLAGFIGGAIAGGRAYDSLHATNRGLPFIVAGVILVAVGGYIVLTGGAIPNEWMRAVGFTLIAFAGGLAVRARNSVMGG